MENVRAWMDEAEYMVYFDLFSKPNNVLQSDIIMQGIGLKDKNNEEWYHEDIGEFENGDRFVIKSEEWVEYFVDWIGEPKCEDQARDLYRISNAKKIGNSFENPELLEAK